MKKRIYLTTLNIITVICIIFGSLVHLFGWFSYGIHIPFLGSFTLGKEKDPGEDFYQPEKDPENISIDVSNMNVTIQAGERCEVTYTGSQKYAPDITEDGTTLTVTQKDRKIGILSNQDKNLTITLSSMYLNSLSINANKGNILCDGIDADNLTTSADLGDITIDSSDFNTADLDADMGQISLNGNCHIAKGTISCDMGNIETEHLRFDELEVEASLGDINLGHGEDLNFYTVDAETDMGDIEIDGQQEGNSYSHKMGSKYAKNYLTIENNMGNISINSGFQYNE